jgi:hypothetical protein
MAVKMGKSLLSERHDKPFHKAECGCLQCREWAKANPLPIEVEDRQAFVDRTAAQRLSNMNDPEHRHTIEVISLSLPDDMADAFESMKLAILRNKFDGWREVSADMTIGALWELQRLAMAESKSDSNPF